MKIFKEEIGFVSKRKNSEMNKICCNRKVNPNKDIIPYLKKKLWEYKNRIHNCKRFCSRAK